MGWWNFNELVTNFSIIFIIWKISFSFRKFFKKRKIHLPLYEKAQTNLLRTSSTRNSKEKNHKKFNEYLSPLQAQSFQVLTTEVKESANS
jgi:hypothetical protein